MKRFYCKLCKKIIRVRKYPVIIEGTFETQPTQRVGVCNWHSDTRASRNPNDLQLMWKAESLERTQEMLAGDLIPADRCIGRHGEVDCPLQHHR